MRRIVSIVIIEVGDVLAFGGADSDIARARRPQVFLVLDAGDSRVIELFYDLRYVEAAVVNHDDLEIFICLLEYASKSGLQEIWPVVRDQYDTHQR